MRPHVTHTVVVPGGGALEPAGLTLTEAANSAAQGLAALLEGQPRRTPRRKAPDGLLYTKDEFLAHYEDDGVERWANADEIEEYEWGSDVHSIVGRALWPR